MHTLFELNTKIDVDAAAFERMMNAAEAELSKAELSKAENSQYIQAIVLLSVKGNEYSTLIKNALSKEKSGETALLKRIKDLNDTEIRYALCLWQDGGIDIPSYWFRKSLCTLDPKNTETLLFVMSTDGIGGIKVSTTMK